MYSKHEKPTVSATLYYYDTEYKEETAKNILSVLEDYHLFPPERIHADKLTKNKFAYADEHTRALFVDAYSEKDVLGLDMASGDSRYVSDYWKITWSFTYYKNSKLVGSCKFLPWNTLTIQSTYGRLKSKIAEKQFLDCVKKLIAVTHAFYASIDDVNNKVELQDKYKIPYFTPNSIQVIYWGNYIGDEIAAKFNLVNLTDIPAYQSELIGNGVFFTLSHSFHEFNTKEVNTRRNQIRRHLHK